MALTDIQEINSDGASVSTDNMSNLMSEQNQDMASDAFGEQVENINDNFDSNQEYLNFSLKKTFKKLAKSKIATVATGGLNKLGSKDTRKNIGKDIKKAGKDIKKVGQKAVQKFKTLNLAPMRGAYLGLVAINMFGLASQAQKIKDEADKGNKDAIKKWKRGTDTWYKMGGNRTKFTDAIKKGSKKKALLKARKNADGTWENVAGADDAALIIAAASAVAAICKAFGGKPKEMTEGDQKPIDEAAAKNEAALQAGIQAEAEANIPESERDSGIGGMSNKTWYIVGASAVGLAVLGFFLLRKKK
jgi:hypothetical protein